MVKVVAKNFIKPEGIKAVEPLFRELVAATQKEEGCIEYRLFFDPKEKGVYAFIEEWASQAALDKHMASEHFTRIFPQISALTSRPGDVLLLDEFK
ncbi:antibiotic biosynthesis monooxygenase [Spirochaetia bacterium]|nr:antibiotic biosynthesis monooxygenase [Spirochaetia bacterium]